MYVTQMPCNNHKIIILLSHVASGERDFVARSVELTFGPGNTEQNVMITIFDDLCLEHDEQFNSIISHTVADPSIDLNPANATITIINEDSKLNVRVQRRKREREKEGGREGERERKRENERERERERERESESKRERERLEEEHKYGMRNEGWGENVN